MSTDAEFVEKLRTLNVSRASRRGPKTTTDVHDHHTVKVTEHWDDRQDVHVTPMEPIRVERALHDERKG